MLKWLFIQRHGSIITNQYNESVCSIDLYECCYTSKEWLGFFSSFKKLTIFQIKLKFKKNTLMNDVYMYQSRSLGAYVSVWYSRLVLRSTKIMKNQQIYVLLEVANFAGLYSVRTNWMWNRSIPLDANGTYIHTLHIRTGTLLCKT